jgi:hypothetical protein
VICPDNLLQRVPEERRETLLGVLSLDPRPAYHQDEQRIYGFPYGRYDVRFRVHDGAVEVTDIVTMSPKRNA